MSDFIQTLTGAQETFVNVYLAVMRFAAPILALILLWRCCKPLLTFRREPEIWAWLCLNNGDKLPITHWENTIGRHKRCDILIDFPTVSRNHAVLTRYDDGSWSITDTHSKDGVTVNGKKVRICALNEGDVISIGGVEMQLQPITHRQEVRLSQLRTRSSGMENVTNLLLLSIFQALTCIGFLMGGNLENATPILFGFGGIMLIQWLLLIFCFIIRRPAFEVETVAFFLCTMGMAAIATVKPGETVKQLVAMVMGIAVF